MKPGHFVKPAENPVQTFRVISPTDNPGPGAAASSMTETRIGTGPWGAAEPTPGRDSSESQPESSASGSVSESLTGRAALAGSESGR